MTAFPKESALQPTAVALPGSSDSNLHLTHVGPSGHRSLDAHVVRQMVGSTFGEMRTGVNNTLANGILSQLSHGDAPKAAEVVAEAEKVLNLVRDGGKFLADVSARLPEWHQRLTNHEAGRGTKCLPELAELGGAPDVCLTEVRGLGDALAQLGSGRNPGFDSGVSAAAKAIKGFGINSFRRMQPLIDFVRNACEVNITNRPYKALLQSLAEKEPSSAAEAALYLQNLRTHEAAIRAQFPRSQAPASAPSLSQVQTEAMQAMGKTWNELFSQRPEEVGRLSGMQRLAIGYTFYVTCVGSCLAGRAVAARLASEIKSLDPKMVREAILVLEARQLCPSVDVRKSVEALLPPVVTPPPPPVTTPAAEVPVMKIQRPSIPSRAATLSEAAGKSAGLATPAADGKLFVREPQVRAAAVPRPAVAQPTAPPAPESPNAARNHWQTVETALMERFGTRDFASAVLASNPDLLNSARKLDVYLGVVDRTRPVWGPLLERGAVRAQDIATVGQLDNLEFKATLTDRLGSGFAREVLRVNPSFEAGRQARAEYLTLLDETRPLWQGRLEGRIAALVVTKSGLEMLQFEGELSKHFGDDSAFHVASRRPGSSVANASARREILSAVGANLPIFKRLADQKTPLPHLVMTATALDSLAEQHRDVMELDDIRKAVLKDGFPFDIILPVLRYGLLESDGHNYALARVSDVRLSSNLKSRIANFAEVEPLFREAIGHLASGEVRALIVGKNGYGLNQYKTGDLAPRYPSLVRLIEWVRAHPPGAAAVAKVHIPAAFAPSEEQPVQAAYPLLQAVQSKNLVENLVASMQAVKAGAQLPPRLEQSAKALSELAAFLRPADANRAVGELVRCYSAIREFKDDVTKDLVLNALERVGAETTEGATALIALTKSPDILLRRISAGVLMQAVPAIVDAAKGGRQLKRQEAILAVFDYIEAEADKQFKQRSAENFMAILQAHTPSWDVVYEVRDKHRLGNIFVEALVEGFQD